MNRMNDRSGRATEPALTDSGHGCGGGACTCGGASTVQAQAQTRPQSHADTHTHADMHAEAQDLYETDDIAPIACVNGVALHGTGESPDPETLRQRAYTELLRQAALRAGLLPADDPVPTDGLLSEAASDAVEALLAQEVDVPEPDEQACRRFHAAHAARYRLGEQVHARHLLYAVTPGVDVQALRARAEQRLIALRCGDAQAFAQAAREDSNCPSGAEGGDLGWLKRDDCAPEFAAALFGQDEGQAHVGVLPRLISTRFGFHVVRVEAREPGQDQDFDAVRHSVAQTLRQQAYVTALRQYLTLLAGDAALEGVELDSAESPLLQ